MKQESRLVKQIRFVLAACQHYGLQDYSCKHSRKDFRQSQLVALLAFKQEIEKPYRETAIYAGEMPRIAEALQLQKLPHFTTMQKALKRFSRSLLEDILGYAALIAVYGDSLRSNIREAQDASFDGTGYFLTSASRYFQERLKRKTKAKHFLHSVIGVLTSFLLIFCSKQKRGPANDSPALIPLLNESVLPLDRILADKGFDSEANLCAIHDSGSEPLIPVREGKCAPSRTKLRKRMNARFRNDLHSHEIYGKRALSETVFSVVKRVYGSVLHARSVAMQKKELMTRYLAYNARRAVQLMELLGRFLQSRKYGSVETLFRHCSDR